MIRSSKYASIYSTIGAQPVMDATRDVTGDDGGTSLPPAPRVEDFSWLQLFANGEKGTLLLPADEHSLYSDVAGTTLITAENGVIAYVKDLSGNGVHATRVSPTLRPKMSLITANGSYRRAIDFDGVDDALNIPLPNLGAGCTIIRARPGIGTVISTNQTITGALNDQTDHSGLIVVNRGLNAYETAGAMLLGNRLAAMSDELNQSYGSDPDEVCDVFHSGPHPKRVIYIMVHGGGWRTGSKASPNVTKNKLQHYLPRGVTFVSANYPMAVGTSPVAQAHSIAKLITWVQNKASSWGCDASQIVLWGHSAGGHLVSLVSVDRTIQEAHDVAPWLGTVVLDSAGYDLVEIMGHSHLSLYDEPWKNGTDSALLIAGSPTYAILDPARAVTPPPMLLVTSTDSNPDESDPNVGPFKDAVNARVPGRATILQTSMVHADVNIQAGVLGAYTDSLDGFLVTLHG